MKIEAKTIKTVWVYSRTSGKSDVEDRKDGTGKVSLEVQEQDGRAIAERLGYTIVGTSSDNNVSGRTYPTGTDKGQTDNDLDYNDYCRNRIKAKARHTRDGLSQFMDHIGEVDAIIIRDITRLARPYKNSGLLLYLFQRMERNGVAIVYHDGKIDTPNDTLLAAVKRFVLSIEDESLEAKHDGHLRSIEEKKTKGDIYRPIRCYGYTMKDHTITEDRKALETVKTIFDMWNTDKPLGKITATLNQTAEGRQWTRKAVKDTLRNPTYCGYHYDHLARKDRQLIQATYMQHCYLPITLEQFQYAHIRLAQRSRAAKEYKDIHPASAVLHCGYCGRKMFLSKTPDGWRYVCGSSRITGATPLECSWTGIMEHTQSPDGLKLYPEVVRAGTGVLEAIRPLLASAILQHLQNQNGTSEAKEKTLAIESAIERVNEETAELTKAKDNGTIPFGIWLAEVQKNKAKLDALQSERSAILANIQAQELTDTLDWRNALAGRLEPVTEQRLIQAVFQRIEVYAYHVRFVFHDGTNFMLARTIARNQRRLPYHDTHFRLGQTPKPEIVYRYSGDEAPSKIVYESPTLLVKISGTAKKPGRWHSLWKTDPEALRAMYNSPLPVDSQDRI